MPGGGQLNAGSFHLDLRNLIVGVLAGLIAAPILLAFGAAPVVTVIAVVAVLLVTISLIGRKQRRYQRAAASVLSDPSSSGSARRALELVRTLIASGADSKQVEDAITTITSLRRYPHSVILQWIFEEVKAEGVDDRDALLFRCDILHSELGLARAGVKGELARYLTGLDSSSIIVLYGYSSTICDALEAAARKLDNPIWVVEDLQYGDASVGEHELVSERLKHANLRFTRLTFDEFLRCAGAENVDTLVTTKGERIVIPRSVELVGVIGCDVSDDRGVFLVPGILRGRPSETLKLVEQFVKSGVAVSQRHLVIATERFKMVPDLRSLDTSTSAPVVTPWWLRITHWLGMAIPYQGRSVKLLAVEASGATVVTDRGTVSGRTGLRSLRDLRESWAAQLQSNWFSAPASGPMESVEMAASFIDLQQELDKVPALVPVSIYTPETLTTELESQALQLIEQCFPEATWTIESFRARVLTPGAFVEAFAIRTASMVFGFVTLHETPEVGTARLHWMAVDTGWRRKNYAMSLIAALVQAGLDRGYSKLVLTTESDKAGALALYRKVGFLTV